jgi:transcriptional regulator with XRE-family HTH domain
MRLSEYLDRYAWSQAEFARQAGISTQSVSRALSGHAVSRRSAEAIIVIINAQEKMLGTRRPVLLTDIQDLHITGLQRRKKVQQPQPGQAQ